MWDVWLSRGRKQGGKRRMDLPITPVSPCDWGEGLCRCYSEDEEVRDCTGLVAEVGQRTQHFGVISDWTGELNKKVCGFTEWDR